MDALEFAVRLLALTFGYALLIALLGNALLDAARQRGWGAIGTGLGLLLAYPLTLMLVTVLPPSLALALYAGLLVALWARIARRGAAELRARATRAVRQAGWVAALSVFFWLPGAVGPHVGLFSDAGGDFTIYAGVPAKLGDAPLWRLSDLTKIASPQSNHPFPNEPVSASAIAANAQPPSAGWSMQRLIEERQPAEYSGWFSLQHALFALPLGGAPEKYLAVLALLWAVLVAASHRLVVVLGGPRHGLVALGLFGGAHALAGVGYNHYLPQLLASTLLACLLAALLLPPPLRLGGGAALGLLGLTVLSLGVAYFPMLPLAAVPVAAFALLAGRPGPPALVAAWREAGRGRRAGWIGAGAVAVLLAAPYYLAQAPKMISFASGFLGTPSENGIHNSSWLGSARPYDVNQLAALFGAFSMQRLPPYSQSDPATSPATWLVAGAGVLLIVLAVTVVVARRNGYGRDHGLGPPTPSRGAQPGQPGAPDHAGRVVLSLGLAVLAVGSLMLWLGRSYEYTQYKALAYAAPMVLLLVALVPTVSRGRALSASAWACAVALLLGLLIHRVDGALAIARGDNRAAVLDASLSRLLTGMYARDPDAFALAYVPTGSLFSLWEYGMRDARGLIMNHYVYPRPRETYIQPTDVEHLWVVRSGPAPGGIADVVNGAGLVAYRPGSTAGCHVEGAALREDRPRPVAAKLLGGKRVPLWGDTDMEFWVYNLAPADTLGVILKGHGATTGDGQVRVQVRYPGVEELTLTLEARRGDEAYARIPAAALPGVAEAGGAPLAVVRIPGAGYSGLSCGTGDLADLADAAGFVAGAGDQDRPHLALVGPPQIVRGRSVTVRWAGIVTPDPGDWIGLFPVGGGDDTRVAHLRNARRGGAVPDPPAAMPPRSVRVADG